MTFRVEWNGPKVDEAAKEAAGDGLLDAAEHLLGASRRIVPHEYGDLERSGAASVDREALRGAVSYDTPYATRQHEELTFRHSAGRRAKYLEGPMAEERDVMLELIAARIRRAL